jgi:hypothetical protein
MARTLRATPVVVAAAIISGCYNYQYLSRNLPDGNATTDFTCPVSSGNQPVAALDFESSLDSAWILTAANGFPPTLDLDSKHCGTHGLHCRIPTSASFAQSSIRRPLTGTNTGDLYLRVYLWPKQFQGPIELMRIEDSVTFDGVAFLIPRPGALSVRSDLGSATDTTPEVAFPEGRWVCIEAHFSFKLDGMSLPIDVSTDGNPALSYTFSIDPSKAFSFSQNQTLYVGLYAAPSGGAELYVDDVVISHTPVGCQ